MKEEQLSLLVKHLIKQGQDSIAATNSDKISGSKYIGFLSASISFIGNVYGLTHSYYQLFKAQVGGTLFF